MITENTVFILGAGASKPYGYPTGIELRRQICDAFPERLSYLLTGKGIPNRYVSPKEVQDALDFAQAFREARVKSIDRYLAINKEFAVIGKIAIALSILDGERKFMFKEELEDNWYFYLYNRMIDGLKSSDSYQEFGDNKITFITFNYDRSLEYYLFNSMINTFPNVPETAIVEQLNKIFRYHVDGQVDFLPWQGGKKRYGEKYSYEEIVGISANIKTMFERSSSETEEVKNRIMVARDIYFLGFGYDKENMKVIGLPDSLKPRHRISGTFLEATEKEKEDVTVFLSKTPGVNPKFIGFLDCGCVDLLRERL